MFETPDPATPERPPPVQAIDLDYTETLEIKGAQFTVGPMPFGKWTRLRTEALEAHRLAVTRAVQKLGAQGKDPEALVPFGSREVTAAQAAAFEDMQAVEDLARVQVEVARWTVRNHSGITNRAGAEIPFVATFAPYEGEQFAQPADQTMRLYRANAAVMGEVYQAAWRLNELSDAEKKA